MVENTFVRKDQDDLTRTFDISIFAIYCTAAARTTLFATIGLFYEIP